MVADYLYHQGKKYWYYGSYPDRDEARKISTGLKKRYKTRFLVFATDSFWGSYPIYHVYTERVRRVWS